MRATSVAYAAAVAEPESAARAEVLAGLRQLGVKAVDVISSPTSGRDDGVTPTRTSVVVCRTDEGRPVYAKFYDNSAQGRERLRRRAQWLKVLHGTIPVPRVICAVDEPGVLRFPVLVTEHLGEPLDGAVQAMPHEARRRVAVELGEAVAALADLDTRALDLPQMPRDELEARVARGLVQDADEYEAAASRLSGPARELVLAGAAMLREAEVRVERTVLAHRDLSAPNVMVRENRFSGLIDWDYGGLDVPALDVGSFISGCLTTIPVPRPERAGLLRAFLDSYAARRAVDLRASLVLALDALLDWIIGGKNAPAGDLLWATSLTLRGLMDPPRWWRRPEVP